MKVFLFWSFSLLILCFCASSFAASAPIDLNEMRRQQEHILLQEQERQQQQREQFLYGKESFPEGLSVSRLEQEKVPSGVPCAQINSIEVTGVTLFSMSSIRAIVDGYEKRCLSLEDINNILRQLTNLYIDTGYVTSRAFMDTSKADQGLLHIFVVEGKVEKILLNDGDKNMYYRGAWLFPG